MFRPPSQISTIRSISNKLAVERMKMKMMRGLRGWIYGAFVLTCAFMCAAGAQTSAVDKSEATGILPTGYSDAVDRDVMKVREATAKFKTTEAAEAAGYKRVTDCVE